MKKFQEFISEEILPFAQTEKGFVGIDNGPVRDNINLLLANVTAMPYSTPYHALEAVRRVLMSFHIALPATNFMSGDIGHEVFPINQFGKKMGMLPTGDVVTQMPSAYYIYFEYQMTDRGTFDIFCEVVDEEELDAIMSDVEDELEDLEHDAEDSYEAYKASNMEEDYDFRAKQDAEDNAAIAKRARKPSEKAFWKKAYKKNNKKAVTGLDEDYDKNAADDVAFSKNAKEKLKASIGKTKRPYVDTMMDIYHWDKFGKKANNKAVTGMDEGLKMGDYGHEKEKAANRDKPPFEGGYKVKGPRKDRFGNIIKTKNIAKYLAKKAEKKWEAGKKLAEEHLEELFGKGSLEKIRDHYKKKQAEMNNKASNFDKVAMKKIRNRNDNNASWDAWDTAKKRTAAAINRSNVAGTQVTRATKLIKKRDKKKTVKKENLNELSKGLLRRYTKKASWSSMAAKFDDDGAKARRRAKGLKRAGDRLGNTMMVKKKYLAKEERLDEISAGKANDAYHVAMDKLQTADIMSGTSTGKVKKKWLKRSEKRHAQAVKFADYADKKSMKEETVDEGTVQKQKSDFRSPKYRYSNNAPHMGPGKFTKGTYMTGTGSYDDKDETPLSHGQARKMTKKYRSASSEDKSKLWKKFWTTGKMDEENINELSKGTLGSYITKASHDVATKSAAVGRHAERANKARDKMKKGDYSDWQQGKKDDEFADKMFKKSWKRRQGIAKATDKLTREETQLDEISGKLARKAEHKSAKDYYSKYDAETKARREAIKSKSPEAKEKAEKAGKDRTKAAKRTIRFQQYADKKLKEEAQLHEVSKQLLQRYKKKADAQAEPLSKKYRKGTISDKDEKTLGKRGMGSSLAMQKLTGYGKPKVLAKEENLKGD